MSGRDSALGVALFACSLLAWIVLTSERGSLSKRRGSRHLHDSDRKEPLSSKRSKAKDVHHTSAAGDQIEREDAIVQIESEIIASEVVPMVRKIDSKVGNGFQPLVIGIAGGSGSGKTTLSRAIVEALGKEHITYIAHDSYYKDLSYLPLSQRETTNFDHPDALDSALLTQHIKQLKAKEVVNVPIYDFTTHNRIKETEVMHPRHIVLVEGILIFTERDLYDLMDIKIFVDTDDDIRLIRRIERDIVERGRAIDKIVAQYLRTVRPMHIQYVQPSKKNADIIVPFGLNSVALDLVISKLRRVLLEASQAESTASESIE